RLKQYLGIETGAVGLLAVINDPDDIVEVYIDKDLWESEYIRFHPLVNTATIKLTQKDLQRIFTLLGHNYRVMQIPTK
ncbi:YbaK/EbsC family protein, partial [Planctomycetota bacterium]